MRGPNDDLGSEADRAPHAGTPRWVKVFAATALLALVALAVLLLFGSGHGPGRHADDPGRHVPPAGVTHGDAEP